MDREFWRPEIDYQTQFSFIAQEQEWKRGLELDLLNVGMKSKPACTYSLLSEAKQTNLFKYLKSYHFKNNNTKLITQKKPHIS